MQTTSTRLRRLFIDFFVRHGHVAIPPGSLVPDNDPSVLFTTAGMHPLVPYLLGEMHPSGTRLTNVQKCIRTGDIDIVGDDTHLTFFEMLGNWSLGDYQRKEAIPWSFELLTSGLGVPLERLGVTCFEDDDDSVAIWTRLGIPLERISRLGREDNWWGPAGQTGPCGPDTEIFYWVGPTPPPRVLDVRDRRWVEIWNNVFMNVTKTPAGRFEPLERSNVATVAVHSIAHRDTGEVVSRELCGGPHVRSTEDLRGRFEITGEQSIASGVRRIRAVFRVS